MRNVYKGFQIGKLAVPKMHAAKINQEFNNHHAPALKKPYLHPSEKVSVAKAARRPGKNVGIRG